MVHPDEVPDGLTPEEQAAYAEGQMIALWLSTFRDSAETRRAYEYDIRSWLDHLDERGRGLRSATLEDTITYQRALEENYQPSTQARKIASVKSLYSLMKKIGAIQINVFAVVRAPSVPSKKAKRYMSESEVMRMFTASRNDRDLALMYVLYYGGLRNREATNLKWGDLVDRPDMESGQLEIFGKGGESRSCLIPSDIWRHLMAIRPEDAQEEDPVFPSRIRRRSRLTTAAIRKIIRETAALANLDKPVSPHWFRHAHISHAVDRGCPMHIICEFVGHKDPSTTLRYTHSRPHDASSLYLPV